MKFFVSPPEKLNFFSPVNLIATWFGAGLLRPASGTWGSLAALPFGVLLFHVGGIKLLIPATILVFAVGVWASAEFAKAQEQADPSSVVVDEVVGQWITLLVSGFTGPAMLMAFLYFRFFDILKPWPIGWIDRNVKGGVGIMLDDVLAGVFAGLACLMTYWIF